MHVWASLFAQNMLQKASSEFSVAETTNEQILHVAVFPPPHLVLPTRLIGKIWSKHRRGYQLLMQISEIASDAQLSGAFQCLYRRILNQITGSLQHQKEIS